ncbi:hypothetical protein [Pararhizobium sp.]|uniref:hypothetical protein n=1 Tax=Pararhizobium sp. TaxID=1977563 RepID=UPI00271BBB62|nr:hypothetical protein [Pararhizobium sp.]MDO9418328.1 hypothetical protein [Pararhizobium sp.]
MEHIAAIMILVGCAQGDTACRELPAPAVGYESVENCHDLLRPAVNQASRTNKTTYGRCIAVDPALFMEDAVVSWKITADKQLDVTVGFDGQDMMAMNTSGAAPKTGRLVN